MFIDLKPKYGINYDAGQVYFTYNPVSAISVGISFYTTGSGDIPTEKVTHCGIVLNENEGIEAQYPQGVSICSMHKMFNDPTIRIMMKEINHINVFGEEKLLLKATSMLGSKYDLSLFFGHLIANSFLGRRLPQRFRDRILKYFDKGDRFICSEFVAWCINEDYYFFDKIRHITPKLLFESDCFKPWKSNLPQQEERRMSQQ